MFESLLLSLGAVTAAGAAANAIIAFVRDRRGGTSGHHRTVEVTVGDTTLRVENANEEQLARLVSEFIESREGEAEKRTTPQPKPEPTTETGEKSQEQ